MSATQQNQLLSIKTVLAADALLIQSLAGRESISALFHFDLVLLSANDAIDLHALLGTAATIRLRRSDGSSRFWHGHIARISQQTRGTGSSAYNVDLVPWPWFLRLRHDCRIFQDKSATQILTEVFRAAGFHDFEFRLQGELPKREYCVQYRESDFQFISRLLEDEGVFYFFDHQDGKHTLVMANHPGAHQPCSGASNVSVLPTSHSVLNEDTISDWRREEQFICSSYASKDYNFQTPSTDLAASLEGDNSHQIYEFPGSYPDRGRGESLARIRKEELALQAVLASGESNCRGFIAGGGFRLRDHYRRDWNQEYVLVDVTHHATQADYFAGSSSGTGEGSLYRNDFSCIPRSVVFRPIRRTAHPIVEGCQTAIVVGPAGEEIHTDKFGRVKVQFHWDRQGKRDQKSSCWIRVSQPWAGKDWGAISIPRIGQEVIVDFLEGNPDRPIITGRVYNSEQMPPYTLPAGASNMGFRSRSIRGTGYNEMVIDDSNGQEMLRLRGHNDMETMVLHDQKESVKNNKNLHVVGEHRVQIDQKASQTVKGDVAEHFAQSHAEIVSKERYIKAGRIILEADQEVCIKVGGNHLHISSAGVYVEGTMVDVNCGHPPLSTSLSGLTPTPPDEAK